MPTYKDKQAGTWYCKFYYQDYDGNRKQKWKGGFALKREAEAYEREFLRRKNFQPEMPFSAFVERYLKDREPRLREHTMQRKRYTINNHILPFFADLPINEITPKIVIDWQNELIKQNFKQQTLSGIHKELSAIFNHAIKFYGLRENPSKSAGVPKSINEIQEPMRFWSLDEFNQVIEHVDDIKAQTALMLLYWSGMRKGELLALTWNKLDFDANTLVIDRSYQRINGKPVVTSTKTGIVRTIMLPDRVMEQLKQYKATCYKPSKKDFIFDWEKEFIEKGMRAGCKASGVKRIHVHGLRHSHASLLIQMGVNVVLISKRLGHEKVSTTLDTYSHFFPTEEQNVINQMNNL